MSDCCKLPAPSPAADGLCRRCGEKARSVLRETMESLLKPEARARLADEPYFSTAPPPAVSSTSPMKPNPISTRTSLPCAWV